jgi:hypothetical protein
MKRASAKHDGNLIWLKIKPVFLKIPALPFKVFTRSGRGFSHPAQYNDPAMPDIRP